MRLYELLHKQELVSPPSCESMLEHLKKCDDDTKLKRDLPKGVTLAHKGGAVNRSRTDGGIIYTPSVPIAICVLTTKNEDRSWGADNKAQRLIGRCYLEVGECENALPYLEQVARLAPDSQVTGWLANCREAVLSEF